MKLELKPGEQIYIQAGDDIVLVDFNKGRKEVDLILFSDAPIEYDPNPLMIGYSIHKPAHLLQVMKESDRHA